MAHTLFVQGERCLQMQAPAEGLKYGKLHNMDNAIRILSLSERNAENTLTRTDEALYRSGP